MLNNKITILSLIVSILLMGCSSTHINTNIDTQSLVKNGKGKSIAIQGFHLLQKKDFKHAKEKLEVADKLGHVDAPRALGLMYINGDGVKQDYSMALYYFKKAYKRGNYVAAYDIGAMYKNGEHFNKNIKIAKKYYLIAAKKDYGLAQFELAKIYAYQRNKSEFIYWAKKAEKHAYHFR